MGDLKLVKLLDPLNITNIVGGLTPKGAYNSLTDYAVGDSVSYNGTSYVMFNNAPAGTLPTNTTYWQVLAAKGSTGGIGDPEWGTVTGNITDQYDLQTALNAKVDASGDAMTGELSMGGNALTNAPVIRTDSSNILEIQDTEQIPLANIEDDGTFTTKLTPVFRDRRYAVNLTGTNGSYISLGAVTYLDGKSWTFGINVDFDNTALTDDGTIFSYGYSVGSNLGYLLRLNGSTKQFQIFSGSASVLTTNAYGFGECFIEFKYNYTTNTMRVYVDSVLKDTLTGVGSRTAAPATTSYIGTRDGTGRNLAATLDGAFLYDRQLTNLESYEIRRNQSYASSGWLFAYEMDETSGTTLQDASPNNNDATIAGATRVVSPFGQINKKGFLPRFQAALASATNRKVNVMMVGTSTTQGLYATTTGSTSGRYVDVLGKIWQSQFNTTGGGRFVRALDTLWSITGTAAEVLTGFGISSLSMNAGATMTATISDCTGIELLFAQGPGSGTFTLTIDGGTPITITPNTGGAANRHDGVYLSNTLTLGSHTFVVTATNACVINGAYINNDDRTIGVRVYNSGHGGLGTNDFVTSGADSMWVRGLTVAPALVGFMITSNDMIYDYDPETTRANLLIMIRKIKTTLTSNPDIVLINQFRRSDYLVSDPSYTYDRYEAVMREIAATEERVYYVDASDLFPLRNTTAHDPENMMDSDDTHMTDAGHALMAQALARRLAPDVRSSSAPFMHIAGTENVSGRKSFVASSTDGAISTNSLLVLPRTPGNSASVFMQNDVATPDRWEFFTNLSGQFGVYDYNNGKQPFTINKNTANNAIVLSTDGVSLSTSFGTPITTKTANYTITTADYTILCDATSGNITVTLPSAASGNKRMFVIKKIDASANTVTIDGNASETIDGATTQVISAQWATMTIQSNGTAWYIL